MTALPLFLTALLACKGGPDDTPVDASADPIEPYSQIDYVDPFIGTGGPSAAVGSINPGAVVPWGMVHAGPATRASFEAPFYHCAGYYYQDTFVTGFGHTFAHGMGVTEAGGLLVMPKNGWDDDYTRIRGRLSSFTHDREWASPGYYAVDLQDDGIHAELTASRRAAMHRYTFEEGADPVLLFDLAYTNSTSDNVPESWITLDPDTGRIQGFQRLRGGYSARFGGLMQHFDAIVDPAPIAVATWQPGEAPVLGDADASASVEDGEAGGVGAYLVFPEGTTEVKLKLGLSYVDVEGAANNLATEMPAWDFEAARAAAEAEWAAELGNVRVRSMHDDAAAAERDLTIFHTAQYHAYQMPRTYTDVDGRFRGFDQQIHPDPGFDFHSDFSGWDTFRTQHPWLTLVLPERQTAMNNSLLTMVEHGGSLPRWPLAHGYTSGMVGTPMIQVLAGSYLKGVTGWDADAAFDAAWSQATQPHSNAGRSDVEHYKSNGFIRWEATRQGAAQGLEAAWSDAALAQWGEAMGRPEAAEARVMADSWRNLWEPESGFFWTRSEDGSFPLVEDPIGWSENFVEGSAWHYVWMVPTDPMGMVDVQHGGDVDAFLERYAGFWEQTYIDQLDEDRIAGLPGFYYWHGNEPDIHYAYLGSLVGHPDASAQAIRFILEHKYDNAGWGIDGNDDGGTLSAWYLFSSIGFFPVAGTDVYAVGSPIFERAEIDLSDGNQLVVRAPYASTEAMFVREARIGDQIIEGGSFTHGELMAGGELVLEMRE